MTVYVVLAHRDPVATRCLASMLSPRPVVLHVDARVAVDAFRGENIHLVPDRERVHWAGYSTIKAINAAMRVALSLARPGEYVVMLSGECFPARPLAEFEEFLFSVPLRQHCDGGGMLESRPDSLARITQRWLFDLFPCRPDVGGVKRLKWQIVKTVARLSAPRPRAHWQDLSPVGGSLWFALTRECVAELLDQAKSHRTERMFRNTYGPDELVWHTLLYNSRWVSHTPEGAILPRGERRTRSYANFHYLGKDRFLDLADYEAIKSSGMFFCRKLRSPGSDSLKERLRLDVSNTNIDKYVR